jgi:D-sedoheptulose 7-phosphate isomerase
MTANPHDRNKDRSKESMLKAVSSEIEDSIANKRKLKTELVQEIAEVAALLVERLSAGHKLMVFGNGGSAADAQHFVAELVGRFRAERKALAAIALTTNTSSLTSIGNDYGFDQVFARQLEALACPGDVVLAISTSGNSANVLRALEYARSAGLGTIGLTGKTGGRMRGLADHCLCVPSDSTARIQEAHILIIHILSGIIEDAFLAAGTTSNQRAVSAGASLRGAEER